MSSMHCDYAGGLLPYRAIQNIYEAEYVELDWVGKSARSRLSRRLRDAMV